MINRRNRILPNQNLRRNLWPKVSSNRTHIAVSQLKPSSSKSVGELIRVLKEPSRDLLVSRINPKRKVSRQHRRSVRKARIVSIRNRSCARAALRLPLMSTRRALREFPLETKQVLEVVVAPLSRSCGPSTLKTARNGVNTSARAEGVIPTGALLFDACSRWLKANILRRVRSTVGLTKGMTTRDQSNGLFIVHRHSAERFANIASRLKRIRISIRSLRIDVDQTHLNSRQRVLQISVSRVSLVTKPSAFGTPVNVFLRLPNIFSSATKAERLEAHRLKCTVAS